MVGIFSRMSGGRGSHRRTRSSLDDRETVLQSSETGSNTVAVITPHGFEAMVDFKPVEHPVEPPDNDLPVKCPAPEPSILNDARVWRERLTENTGQRADLPVVKDKESQGQPDKTGPKFSMPPAKPVFLPSLSAPERSIMKLLEECNVAED